MSRSRRRTTWPAPRSGCGERARRHAGRDRLRRACLLRRAPARAGRSRDPDRTRAGRPLRRRPRLPRRHRRAARCGRAGGHRPPLPVGRSRARGRLERRTPALGVGAGASARVRARERRRDRDHAGAAPGAVSRGDAVVPRRRARGRARAGHRARLDDRPSRLRRARRGRGLPGGRAPADAGMTPVVVSFDLDETLWDFMPMMNASLERTIAALERRRPELAGRLTVELLHEERRLVSEERTGTYLELRLESFRRVLAAHHVHDPDLPGWMVEEWMAARPEAVRLHDDVGPELDALEAAGRVLGAITNGNFPFARLPVARRFAFVVHAEEVGELKPAPAAFRRAVELCGGDPQRWVHVGDGLDTDIEGAQACGMKAVWINRAGLPRPE